MEDPVPTEITTVTYRCDVCRDEFKGREAALGCEKRGYAVPQLFEGMVVSLSHLKDRSFGTRGVVYQELVSSPHQPHLLPYYYEVYVRDPRTQGRSSPFGLGVVLSVESLKPMYGFRGRRCPICASKDVELHVKSHYLPFNSPNITLASVEMLHCRNCGITFLSWEQVKTVKIAVVEAMALGGIPAADQEKLIRNKEYYYT